MHIVHLINNKVWGGGERYVLDLALRSVADGNEATIVVPPNRPEVAAPFTAAGLHVECLKMGGVLDIVSPIVLARYLERIADGRVVVHTHNFKTAQVGVRARRLAANKDAIRVVCTRHLVKPASTSRISTDLYNRIDDIVFVSELAKNEFLSSSPRTGSCTLHVVHNSVAAPEAPERAESAPGSPLRLFFAGRIAPEKGLDVLVKALGKGIGTDWELNVCGVGDSRSTMPVVRLARGLEIDKHIKWHAHVDNIYPLLAQCDVAVVPSVRPESFGLTVIEAMSQGVPVVTTDNGAQKEFLRHGKDGLLVPPANPDALADALRTLAADPALRLEMGRNAMANFRENLAYDCFYNRIKAVYNGR